MASKIKCPNCRNILKEEGDEMKQSQGEYRVYENQWNSKHEAGEHIKIECLVCSYISEAESFR